ncbi:MAG: universal stress protein [Tepidiformaceae bacterium]
MSRVVVPLDESELAEEALPWAALFAKVTGAEVHLVSVWTYDEAIWTRAGLSADAEMPEIRTALQGYLERTAASPVLAGLTVTTEVRVGDVSDQLVDVAREGETELVVITSHGRGGFKRFVQGSIASELAQASPVPLLVDRSGGIPAGLTRILVTLDGSETAEISLAAARDLAKAAGAEVHLLRVYNPYSEFAVTPMGPAGDMGDLAGKLYESAEIYMKGVALDGETWEIRSGRPLDVILEYAVEKNCEVIAMATHGRGGVIRLALGSTSDAVMRAADRPVLLIPTAAPDES